MWGRELSPPCSLLFCASVSGPQVPSPVSELVHPLAERGWADHQPACVVAVFLLFISSLLPV